MKRTLDGDIEQALIQKIKDMMQSNRNNDRQKSIKIAKELKACMNAHIEGCKMLDEAGVPYEEIEFTGETIGGIETFRIKNK